MDSYVLKQGYYVTNSDQKQLCPKNNLLYPKNIDYDRIMTNKIISKPRLLWP